MFRLLFLCTGNSGRSVMAQCFSERLAPEGVEVVAAGDKNHKLHQNTIRVFEELGYDISKKVVTSVDNIRADTFDIVITLCNKAREICPEFPGSPAKIHWSLADPATKKDPDEMLMIFRMVRDEIRLRVISLFKHGFFNSIREMRKTFVSLLNNLTDGVMAHGVDRRVFFFNNAAERITGYKREEVIGLDCHKVFPGRFCGGDCSFCNERENPGGKLHYPRVFHRKNGELRNLEMTVVNLDPPGMISGALVVFRDITQVIHLRKRLDNSRGFLGIIGRHPSMIHLFQLIKELADVQVPILIQGETGSGKDMVANALHQLSKQASGPFVPINCAALPEGTLESELFGHVKGAFTGAIRDRKGRFELADGGTIFLDEIGEISTPMQVKLLRVIQERCFVPVGGEKTVKMNARVICATNRDLKLLTQQGLFREDLYYRLAVVPINLPSLRERTEDISILAEHFLDKYSDDIGKRVTDLSEGALELLVNYPWPGNVRELSNAIQFAMIKCDNSTGIIEKEHLPPEIFELTSSHKKLSVGRPQKIDFASVQDALQRSGGNKAKAAKLLGVSRTTLYRIASEKV